MILRRKVLCRSSFSIGRRTAKIHALILAKIRQPVVPHWATLVQRTMWTRIHHRSASVHNLQRGSRDGKPSKREWAAEGRPQKKAHAQQDSPPKGVNASKKPRAKWAAGLNR